MKRPTIGDIARRAGVSKAAVSYALNGRPGVSAETRDRVARIADALGWRANTAARALSGERAGVVGLLLAEPSPLPMIAGIERELAAAGMALQFAVAGDPQAEMEIYQEWWAARRVDGVLIVDPRADDHRIGLLRKLDIPAAVVGASAPGMSAVQSDPGGCREAVRHLGGRGHQRVGRVAGPAELRRTAWCGRVFRLTVKEVLGTASVEIATEGGAAAGVHATRQLLALSDPPSAVVYDNDVMAAAAVVHAGELGVRIPADLAVVSWHDSLVCEVVYPTITAIRQDSRADGAAAVRLLLHQLRTGVPGETSANPDTLVVRGSS